MNSKPSNDLDIVQISANAPLDISFTCTEFTCRCPVTGQPDYAEIDIFYQPSNGRIIESKSFKLYLETFRERGIFHEQVALEILDTIAKQALPRTCSVGVRFNSRGGIAIEAKTTYISEAVKREMGERL